MLSVDSTVLEYFKTYNGSLPNLYFWGEISKRKNGFDKGGGVKLGWKFPN